MSEPVTNYEVKHIEGVPEKSYKFSVCVETDTPEKMRIARERIQAVLDSLPAITGQSEDPVVCEMPIPPGCAVIVDGNLVRVVRP